jgi:hypothetical protein
MATAAKDTSGLLGALGMDEATIQRQLDEQRIQQIAEMTNEQRIASLGARAGMDIGRGIAGLFGVESQDPRVKQVAELGRIRAGIDPTNEESVNTAARKLTSMGFGDVANDILKTFADTEKERQLGRKAKRETEALIDKASGLEARIGMLQKEGYDKVTASAIASNDTAFNSIVSTKDIATPADYAVAAKSLGFAVNGKLKDYTPEQVQKMELKVLENKREIAKAGSTKVTVPLGEVFDKMWSTQDAKAQNEAWDLKGQSFQNIPVLRDKLGQVRDAIDTSFTGTGANTKLALSKLARTLSLPVDVNKASNTEIAEAFTTQFAVSELKKNFGSNPAVKDFEAQLKIKPNIVQEPETMKKLIDGLLKGLDAEAYAYNQGEAYKKNNKGSMSGFNVYSVTNEANSKISRLDALQRKAATGLTGAEKAEAIKLQSDLKQWIK